MSKRILWLSTAGLAFLLAVGLGSVAQAGPSAICGDGLIEGSEFCDDGNTLDGDGCSSACQYEQCGEGTVDPVSEECDTGSLCEDGSTDCTIVSTPGTEGGPDATACVGIGGGTCAPRDDVGDGCSSTCTLECGDTVIQLPEECDDGNRVGGDGCDEMCINEICGNGVLQVAAGEECDDGNTVSGDGCEGDCTLPPTGPQTKAQQKCINSLNKDDGKVKKARNKEVSGCLKGAAKGTVVDFDTCMRADAKGKVGKNTAKTCSNETKKCDPADLPTFAYTDCATVNTAANDSALALATDTFGDPATQPVTKAADKAGSGCQKDIQKNSAKLLDTVLKEANKAKKNGLKGKGIPPVQTAAELTTSIQAGIATSSKIAKQSGKVVSGAAKKCAAPVDVATLFPTSACPTTDLATFTACIGRQAICRAVENLNAADNLTVDPSVVAGGTCL